MVLGVCLFFFTAGAVDGMAQTYPIKFDRLKRVGDRYTISTISTTEQHVTATMQGTVVSQQDSGYAVHFTADAEVTGRDVDGTAIINYVVVKCVKYADEDTLELARPGAEIIFRKSQREAGSRLESKNGDVSAESLKYVEDALAEIGSGHADEDIGTRKPQPVGGTWKINTKRAAEQLNESGSLNIKQKNIKGTAKLASVSEIEGMPAMSIQLDIDIDKVGLPGLKDYKAKKSTMAVRYKGDYPLDETKGPLRTSVVLTLDVEATGKPEPNYPAIDLVLKTSRSSVTMFKYK